MLLDENEVGPQFQDPKWTPLADNSIQYFFLLRTPKLSLVKVSKAWHIHLPIGSIVLLKGLLCDVKKGENGFQT